MGGVRRWEVCESKSEECGTEVISRDFFVIWHVYVMSSGSFLQVQVINYKDVMG